MPTFRAALAATLLTTTAFAATINLGTGSGDWTITGAGAIGVPALARQQSYDSRPPVTLSWISVTDNGYADGTFVSGGSLDAFTGFWYADEVFSLPGDATNIKLTYSDLYIWDRGLLQLNGLGNAYNIGNDDHLFAAAGGIDLINYGDLYPEEEGLITPFPFSGNQSGIVTHGFHPGGENLLRLIVNGSAGWNQPLCAFCGPVTFGTQAAFNATLSYDSASESAPEPGSLFLILAGFAPLAWRLRRRM